MLVWLVHDFLLLVSELCECLIYVAWHREIDFLLIAVPVEADSTVLLAFPIFVDNIEFLKGTDKVVRMLFSDILHTKVVDNEAETDGMLIVFPKSWCFV